MDAALRRGMTLEEFLAWDEGQQDRWEFDGFEPVAMVGGTQAHSAICMNLAAALVIRLRGTGCTPHNDSTRVHAAGSVRHPDAYVSCGPFAAGSIDAENPVVVFEVLSPSTASTDHVIKNAEYRDTPSIQRYVLLAQDRIAATVFERRGADWVGALVTDPGATLEMPEIGIAVPMAELYIGVIAP